MSDKRLILAADVDGLPAHLVGNGFTSYSAETALEMLESAETWFGPRDTLETFDAFRQIIPYVIATHKGAIVAYTRTPKGGETRLHGKVSIGLGGHIDLPDAKWDADGRFSIENTLFMGAARELQEELGLEAVPPVHIVGMIALSDTPVDQVHLGVVCIVDLDELPEGDIENALEDVRLVTVDDLKEEEDRLENWTKVLLPHLPALLA